MIKITFSLPDEIEALIKSQGYDVAGYIELNFARPLLDALKAQKRQQILKEAEPAIEAEAEAVKTKLETERHDFADITVATGKEGTDTYKEEVITVEVDQVTKQPLEELPKGTKIITSTDTGVLQPAPDSLK